MVAEERGLLPREWAESALPEMRLPPYIVGWLYASVLSKLS